MKIDKYTAMFLPEIVTTSRRPDITNHRIYSPSEKQGIIIELIYLLTPAEENLAQANFRKKKPKYEDLIQARQSAGWELKYFPVEVG